MSRDVLEQILSAAVHEKALAQDSVADFAAGLRDRARLIIEERMRPLQDRVDTLEKENAWRAASIESLTDENARVRDENRRVKDENLRVREEHARLLDEIGRLKEESRAVQDECRRLEEEMEGVRAEWRTASAAHDRLLQHHRGVIRGAAESLAAVAELPVWKRGQARARLADIAAALRRDTA